MVCSGNFSSCRQVKKSSDRTGLMSLSPEALRIQYQAYGNTLTNYMVTKNRSLKSQKFQRNSDLGRGERALVSVPLGMKAFWENLHFLSHSSQSTADKSVRNQLQFSSPCKPASFFVLILLSAYHVFIFHFISVSNWLKSVLFNCENNHNHWITYAEKGKSFEGL